VLEKLCPANAAEGIGQVDASCAESYFGPVGMSELSAKKGKVEVNSLVGPNQKGNQGHKEYKTQNQLMLLQAFSVSQLPV
jgi:hypothetical protein